MNLSESVADKAKASKVVRKLQKAESQFRKAMYELDKVLNKDKVNKKLSTELKKEYRSNVTKFMRTMLGLKKKVK